MSEPTPLVEDKQEQVVEDKERTPVPEAVSEKAKESEEAKPAEENAEATPTEPLTPSASQWFTSYSSYLGTVGEGWMNKAKEQVEKTLESVKKDLNEFQDTMNTEANNIKESVKQQAELFQQFVTTPDAPQEKEGEEKKDEENKEEGFSFGWMKSVVDTVKSLAIEDTASNEEDFTEPIRTGVRKTTLDQFRLLDIQNSEETFLKPPLNNIELYKDWLKEFKLSEYNGEINILLANNPKLREIYAKFVPSRVDNHTFWNRYFFKVYVTEMEQEINKSNGKIFEELAVDTNALPATPELKVKDEKKVSEVSPSATENESWSVCSSGADDLQEFPEDLEEPQSAASTNYTDAPTGPLTPKASDKEETSNEWERW